MKDFKISQTNGLNILHGDFEITFKTDRIAQHIKTALYTFKKEWIFDETRGVDYPHGLKNTDFLEHEIRKQILNVKGVDSIINYEQKFNKDTLSVEVVATIKTCYGTINFSEQIRKDYSL